MVIDDLVVEKRLRLKVHLSWRNQDGCCRRSVQHARGACSTLEERAEGAGCPVLLTPSPVCAINVISIRDNIIVQHI